MQILNPNTAIAECLETAFSLKTYVEIMDEVKQDGFKPSQEFMTKFNGFFRVRQIKPEWYEKYYKLLEEQKISKRSFGELLHEMYMVNHSIDVSIVSKIMATVDAETPIWDQYVIRNLGYEKKWESLRSANAEKRIAAAEEIYEGICQWYRFFPVSEDGRACISAFDSVPPSNKNKLSAVKKIDYMLWSKR